MSKLFSKVESKFILLVLDYSKKHDLVKYVRICTLLDSNGIRYQYNGKKHFFISDSAQLCTGVNDQSDTAALSFDVNVEE